MSCTLKTSTGLSGNQSRTRRFRRAFGLGLCALALLAVIAFSARRPILRAVAKAWVVDEAPRAADAILLLSGKGRQRSQSAARLYHAGWAPRILITRAAGMDWDGHNGAINFPGYERTLAELAAAGVPSDAMELVGDKLATTWDESQAAKVWVKSTGARRLIITTDALHTRRVRWLFHHELDSEHVALTIVADRHGDRTIGSGSTSDGTFGEFLKEFIKSVYYRVRY